MSPSVVSAHLVTSVVAADGEEGFQTPGVGHFWWPLFGGDSDWAFTRPALVAADLGRPHRAGSSSARRGKLRVVPTKRQWLAEGAYSFVRNTIAPRHHRQPRTSCGSCRCCSRCSR